MMLELAMRENVATTGPVSDYGGEEPRSTLWPIYVQKLAARQQKQAKEPSGFVLY